MDVAREYLTAVLRRSREPMEPFGFTVDWSDHPRKGKFYPEGERLALPRGPASAAATVDGALFAPPAVEPAGFTLPMLSDMLLYSYGQLGRRLALHANSNVATQPRYAQAGWSRGTASGGGLYPVSVYWAAGPGGPVLPGVYHYSTTHHAMHRLLVGDVTGTVAEALGDTDADPGTGQYLVLGLKFWQNAFKYNSFSYHAVTMDLGTVVQTWKMWARAHGAEIAPVLWFDERRLADVLGISTRDEGVFAVVPLRWEGSGVRTRPRADGRDLAASGPDVTVAAGAGGSRRAAVRTVERELSRRTLSFDAVTAMQDVTVAGGLPRPVPQALKSARIDAPHEIPYDVPATLPGDTAGAAQHATAAAGPGQAVRPPDPRTAHGATRSGPDRTTTAGADPRAAHVTTPGGPDRTTTAGAGRATRLPEPLAADMPLRAALSARRSSFGRFSGHRPTRPEQLATVLAAAGAAADFTCDVSVPGEELGLAGLYVFANHVAGVAPGVHRYDPAGHRLLPVGAGARGRFLQDTYFLDNYNLEQAGAVIVPTVRAAAVLEAVGARGYRLTNAVVGAVAQAVYTTAPAVGLGCGVALGFDNVAYAEEFGVQDTDESPLLIMLVGHERSHDADFRYDLV